MPVDRTQSNPGAASSAAPSAHPADRLLTAIDRLSAPCCVGIDPDLEKLPAELRRKRSPADAITEFSLRVLEAVAAVVPVVKFQSACFERYGGAGLAGLEACVKAARERELVVILDFKRGDIGISAAHYAAVFERAGDAPDWVTVHSYLGRDSMTPFLKDGHGAFALVRTSNPSSDEIQDARLERGVTVAEHVAEMVAELGGAYLGDRGYSALGAVVAATKPERAAALRRIMPQQILLVPGFGAQGGSIDGIMPCFNSDGTGAVVSASRSVIYAFAKENPSWVQQVADAAAAFADEVGTAVGLR